MPHSGWVCGEKKHLESQAAPREQRQNSEPWRARAAWAAGTGPGATSWTFLHPIVWRQQEPHSIPETSHEDCPLLGKPPDPPHLHSLHLCLLLPPPTALLSTSQWLSGPLYLLFCHTCAFADTLPSTSSKTRAFCGLSLLLIPYTFITYHDWTASWPLLPHHYPHLVVLFWPLPSSRFFNKAFPLIPPSPQSPHKCCLLSPPVSFYPHLGLPHVLIVHNLPLDLSKLSLLIPGLSPRPPFLLLTHPWHLS